MNKGTREHLSGMSGSTFGVLTVIFFLFATAGFGGQGEDETRCFDVIDVQPLVETAHSIAVSDLNEDGRLDLAVISHLPVFPETALAVFLGDEGGGFSLFESLPVGEHNHGVIAVDLNRDGHLDLATTTSSVVNPKYDVNVVHTFLGDGSGRFPRHDIWPVVLDHLGPLDVKAADLDGDGLLDLVVAGVGLRHLAVLIGDGSGRFEAPRFFAAVTRCRTSVIADFNNDGHPDVVVANRYGFFVSLLLGDGSGNLSFYNRFRTGVGPRSVISADFDGDGNLDLAVSCREANKVWVLFGDGSGDFPESKAFGVGRDPRSVRTGDFNEDGWLDVAVANNLTQDVSLLFGNGERDFPVTATVRVGDAPVLRRVDKSDRGPGVGFGIVGLDVGDFTRDGWQDLVVTSAYDDRVYLLLNRCQGSKVR